MSLLWTANILLETLLRVLTIRKLHSKMPNRDPIDPGQLRHQGTDQKPTLQAIRRHKLELHPGKSS